MAIQEKTQDHSRDKSQDKNQDKSKAQAGITQQSRSGNPSNPGQQNGALKPQSTEPHREPGTQSSRERNRVGTTGSGMTPMRSGRTSPVSGGANSPFAVMRRMSEDMERLVDQLGFGRMGLGLSPRFGSLLDDVAWPDQEMRSTSGLNTVWTPQVEAFQRGDKLVVRADVPGVKKDDVHVDIENDVLTISGERRDEHEEDRDGFYRSERSYGQFYRAIALPEGVNPEQCEASFEDGVLEITVPTPRREERKAKRIAVK